MEVTFKERKRLFLRFGNEYEETSVQNFYRYHVVNPYWGFMIKYFLRYIDCKPYDKVMKLDLWDETVAMFTDIRKNIIKFLKPKKIYYIEFVKEFCNLFKKMYNSKNEVAINDNINNWPFGNCIFDAIIDISTSDHLNLKEFKKFIADCQKTLAPGGYLVLLHLNKNYQNMGNFLNVETKYINYPRSDKLIEKIVQENGLKIIKKKYFLPYLFDTSLISLHFYMRMHLFFYKIFNQLYFYLISTLLGSRQLNIFVCYLIQK